MISCRIAVRRALRLRRLAGVLGSVALLASCGGGGSSDQPLGGTTIGLPASSSVAQQCAIPRPGSGDVQGGFDTEKAFLRSWIDETYLWYQDVRALSTTTLDATRYPTPLAYFEALKTPLRTASGKDKDEFHFTYDTPAWIALSQSGVSYGYGMEVALVSAVPPRRAVVAFSQAATPAAAAAIGRGAEIVTVDGVDVADGSDVSTLNAGLFPQAAGPHTLAILDPGASAPRSVTLVARTITELPVPTVRTMPAPNANVGYLLFNAHIATAESALIAAVDQLKGAGVTDLVLDIRYNGGGFLDLAAELAYMIAGPNATSGKTFERLAYNDRHPFGPVSTGFWSTGRFSAAGATLPHLDLDRVFVLTTADTCSASEAVVNGLRGAGVAVHLIGGTTCGKPYGFFPKDNCGTTYFAIQFQGVNQVGFGDYADGFAPTCAVADDFTRPLGDPAESQLAVALAYRDTGACAVPSGARPGPFAARRPLDGAGGQALTRPPLRDNRFYRPDR
jgi:hypothetical protein